VPDHIHVLVVRAGGLSWALPMESVEQAFNLGENEVRNVGSVRVVRYRDEVLELIDLAEKLELESQAPGAAVVTWASGRRFALVVDELVNQITAERSHMPRLAQGDFTDGVIFYEDQVVPLLAPGSLTGAWDSPGASQPEFTAMQQSALAEIANLGSGHAATALSGLLGRPVDVGYSEATLTVLARAIDEVGAPMNRSALVDTPIQGDEGNVILIFPEESAAELCGLLGTSIEDETGRSALQEVGNILSASYLNAIVEMTGLALEPDPPTVEVDLLGQMIASSAAASGNPSDPTVFMRSYLTVEGSTTTFSFLFVPRLRSVEKLLDALGVGNGQAA
jgi:chemotaxis protein CheC